MIAPDASVRSDWTADGRCAETRAVKPSRSTVNHVAASLRAICLEAEQNTLIGSEEAMVVKLGAARATVRQAARLLEREGLLTVRRGINGGYFSDRPDAATIETAVSAYLDTLSIDIADVSTVASVLWMEVIRKACNLRSVAAVSLGKALQRKVSRVRSNVAFRQLIDIEHDLRTEVFNLTDARYLELIFQINYVFSRRRYIVEERIGDRPSDPEFVRKWRDAKMMELQAIVDGDAELGIMATTYARKLWQERFSLDRDLKSLPPKPIR